MNFITKNKALTVYLVFAFLLSNGQQYFPDSIYNASLKTVLLYKTGKINTVPIIDLMNQLETITLAFDDMSGEYRDLQYKVIHCNENWVQSDLFESDFLEGNTYEAITDNELSFNTYVDYANYRVTIPNENMKIKLPGNYVLIVYSANDEENVLLTKRFYVLSRGVKINAQIKRPTYAKYINRKQEVDFEIDYDGLQVMNPMQDIKVIIRQNQRWDNQITGLKPNYVQNTTLIYNYEEENLFDGLTEWRFVDMRSVRNIGRGIHSIKLDTCYHIRLLVDEDRSLITYGQWADANGERILASDDKSMKYNELDYVNALFRLTTPFPAEDEEVYLFGAFTDWKLKPEFKMNYFAEKNMFYKNVLVKQGYYNYYYALKGENGIIDCSRFQGTHDETENDYHIFVYSYSTVYNADLLVGYLKLNSFSE